MALGGSGRKHSKGVTSRRPTRARAEVEGDGGLKIQGVDIEDRPSVSSPPVGIAGELARGRGLELHVPRLIRDDEVPALLHHDGLPGAYAPVQRTSINGQTELVIALPGTVCRGTLRAIALGWALAGLLARLGTFPEQLLVSEVTPGRVHLGAVASVDPPHQVGKGGVRTGQALALWVGQRWTGHGISIHDPVEPPAPTDGRAHLGRSGLSMSK